MKSSFVLLMAGSGTRSGLKENKCLVCIEDKPLFAYSLEKALLADFDEYILVLANNKSQKDFVCNYLKNINSSKNIKITYGGKTRNESVKNALKEVTCDVVFFHDAARCLISLNDLNNLLEASSKYICGTLYHESTDTLKKVTEVVKTIDRNNIYQVTTPQFFNKELFNEILNNELDVTDEIALFEKDYDVAFIKETTKNIKLTTTQDYELITKIIKGSMETYFGHSLDYHPFSNEGNLILGGVTFNDYPILSGHSDADVVYHVVTEAIMGASLLGDLGTLFPDTDLKYKGIASRVLLEEVISRIESLGYIVNNVDVIVYLLKPNLKDYKIQMAKNISSLTNCMHVNVKAATLNKRGLISLSEGIGAEAVVSLKKFNI